MSQSRKRIASLRPFVRNLSDLAAGLPTDEEVRNTREAIDVAIAFLQRVRESLATLPTSDTASTVQASLSVFDSLLDQAEGNALLGLALGMPPKKRAPGSRARIAEVSTVRGRELADSLADLTVDQVRERLMTDPAVRLSDLRSLAAHLHVRYQSRSTRDALAQALTSRIANARGYDALSSSSDQSDDGSA